MFNLTATDLATIHDALAAHADSLYGKIPDGPNAGRTPECREWYAARDLAARVQIQLDKLQIPVAIG